MSDSGFTGLPTGARARENAFPPSRAELTLKIVEVRGELKAQKTREKMEGEIVKREPNGRVHIRTDRAEIVVQPRNSRDLPPEGQKVEIEIPPGRPARQVTVRPAPTNAAASITKESAPPPTPTAAAQPQTPVERGTATKVRPADVTLPPPTSAPAPQQSTPNAASNPPLETGQLVRLLPLPPHQSAQTAPPPLEEIIAQLTALPLQTAQIAAGALVQRITGEQIKTLLTATTPQGQTIIPPLPPLANPVQTLTGVSAPIPLVPPSAVLQTNAQGKVPPSPVQQTLTSTLKAVLQLPAAPVVQPGAKTQANTAPSAPTLLPSAALATAPVKLPVITPSPAALTFSITSTPPTPSLLNAPLPVKLDAQVTHITPAPVQILSSSAKENTEIIKQAPLRAPSNPFFNGGGFKTASPSSPQDTARTISAQVTGTTPQKLPVLALSLPGVNGPQTEFFVLQWRAGNLPQGAQIQLIPQTSASTPSLTNTPLTNAPTSTAQPLPLLELSPGAPWPVMDELYQTLQQVAPQSAHTLQQTLPQAGNAVRLPVTAFFFIAAVRSGDVSGWLGDKNVESLRKAGKGSLLERVKREFSALNRAASSAPESSSSAAQEWRTTALPLLWGEQVHKILLHYRHDEPEHKDTPDQEKNTRFIFDLDLTRMGNIQLDGLHRPDKLDLIVRSSKAFSTAMKNALRGAYGEALESAHLSGELSFQNTPEQWVKIRTNDSPKETLA